jgi:hypothetical protein
MAACPLLPRAQNSPRAHSRGAFFCIDGPSGRLGGRFVETASARLQLRARTSGPDLAEQSNKRGVVEWGEDMGHILFRGREPFDLIAQRLPSAIAENRIVVATVSMFASGFPGNSVEVRLLLNPHQAEDLARQLLLEAKKARESQTG